MGGKKKTVRRINKKNDFFIIDDRGRKRKAQANP